MRRNVFGFMTVTFGLLCAVAPALAHHSFAAEYDRSKPVKFTGTVTKTPSRWKGSWRRTARTTSMAEA